MITQHVSDGRGAEDAAARLDISVGDRVTYVDADLLTRHVATVREVDLDSGAAHLVFDDETEGFEPLSTIELPMVFDLPAGEFRTGGWLNSLAEDAGYSSGWSAVTELGLWSRTVREAIAIIRGCENEEGAK